MFYIISIFIFSLSLRAQDFEWTIDGGYLDANKFTLVLEKHFVISPDESKVAYVDSWFNGNIFIRDLLTGDIVEQLDYKDKRLSIESLCWISDGKLAYVYSADHVLGIYDLENKTKEEKEFRLFTYNMEAIDDDNLLAVVNVGGRLNFAKYNLTSESVTDTIEVMSNWGRVNINFSDDKQYIFTPGLESTTSNNTIYRIRKISTADLSVVDSTERISLSFPGKIQSFSGLYLLPNRIDFPTPRNPSRQGNGMQFIVFDEDLNIVSDTETQGVFDYIGNDGSRAYLYNPFADLRVTYDIGADKYLDTVLNTPLGGYLSQLDERIYHSNFGKLQVYDNNYVLTNEIDFTLPGYPQSFVSGFANLNDEDFVAGSAFGKLLRYNTATGDFIEDYKVYENAVRTVKTTKDYKYMAVGLQDGIRVYKDDNEIINERYEVALDADFSTSNKFVAFCAYNDSIRVYDLETKSLRSEFDGGSWIDAVEFLDDNRIAVGEGKDIVIYDIDSGSELFRRSLFSTGFANQISDLSLSPDGSKLAIATNYDVLGIMNTFSYSVSSTKPMEGYSKTVEWAEDSKHLLLICTQEIMFYNTENGNVLYRTENVSSNEESSSNERFSEMLISPGNEYHIYATDYQRISAIRNPLGPKSVKSFEIAESIYPNPARDIINIPESQIGKEYMVTDIEGRVVMSGTAANSADISALATGTYHIIFISDNIGAYSRFVKK
jgi:WD40 repeat protein